MTRLAPVHSRANPLPAGGTTVHVVSDTHHGLTLTQKLANVVADALHGTNLPVVAARVITGDVTNSGAAGEIIAAQAMMTALGTTPPTYLAMGNHDFFSGATPAQFATAYGQSGPNMYVDVGDVRLILLNPDKLQTDESDPTWDSVRICLSTATLTWLAARLTETTRDCLIFCHAPIYNTVLGGGVNYDSAFDPWFVTSEADRTTSNGVLAVLGAHANAKAWISGHVHCPPSTPQFIKSQTVGTHTMAMISTSAVAYTGINVNNTTQPFWSPVTGNYITHYPDRIEIRFRNHGGRFWNTCSGAKTVTVTL